MISRTNAMPIVDTGRRVYALQHIDSGEYICLLQDGIDFLACFSSGDDALQFRLDLGLVEHVNLRAISINDCPFSHFWLDGSDIVLEQSPR